MILRNFLLVFVSLLAISLCAVQEDLLKSVPGYGADFNTSVYSGYLNTANNSRQLHYVFVESVKGKNNSDPVTLWLNGGPGCSSMIGIHRLTQDSCRRSAPTSSRTEKTTKKVTTSHSTTTPGTMYLTFSSLSPQRVLGSPTTSTPSTNTTTPPPQPTPSAQSCTSSANTPSIWPTPFGSPGSLMPGSISLTLLC